MKRNVFKYTNYYTKLKDCYKCTLCGNTISTQGNMVKHIKNVHDDVITDEVKSLEKGYCTVKKPTATAKFSEKVN